MSLDKSPYRIANMFDALAHRYDLMNDLMTAFSHRRTRKIAVKLLNFHRNKKALDLATGTGDLAILLHNKAPGTIVGVDFSTKMIKIALSKLKKKNYPSAIEFSIADLNRLPFQDDAFDVCTIAYGIRNVLCPLQAFEEIYRVIKKGGRFLVVEATPPNNSILKYLALFHLRKLAPRLAKLLSSNSESYTYLAESIDQFPQAERFEKIMRNFGWNKVRSYPMYLGIVTLFTAIK